MILIEHGTIITVDRERRILTDGSVLVEGRRIVAVGRAVEVRPPRPPDRVIDARRMAVLPGFVDTHVHLSEHVNRGLVPEDVPVDRYLPDWLVPLYAAITPEEEIMYLVATLYKDTHLDVRVMPAERALEMATVHGAAALGLEDEIGSIEAGKRADLVLYDLDTPEWRPLLNPVANLVYAATGASVRTVLIDGRIVLDDGRFTTVDETEVYRRVETLAREQIRRAGLRVETRWPLIP